MFTVNPSMEDSSLIQPIGVKNLSPHFKSLLRRLDFRGETILTTDDNEGFGPMRAHAYGGADQSSGGEPLFVIRTDVELRFNRDCGEERRRREPAKPLAVKGGKVKPGKTLNNKHHGMLLCTLRESDGSKPARNKESFRRVIVMDSVQEKDYSPCAPMRSCQLVQIGLQLKVVTFLIGLVLAMILSENKLDCLGPTMLHYVKLRCLLRHT